ncbi:HEAT repeat domain-containing protein [Actinoplanes sp. L3-i22]|uniref:HEAT repeat domain-containing protein n=1 Tax=Actinoplanes sp. L3-i22 TaxID=2836373 RepID=UPI001C7648B8|nr:HEAT repeat domain-containing protein [Actinoplanes sp. L3-i22]BCY09380.1 hypothetical protein L3i22_044680 [Actinoplanes sp. L3-i22]
MTPVSGPVRAAVHRADLDWLSAHLGAGRCTPAVLRLLVRHADPRLRHLGLDRLDARLSAHRADPAELAELAELLPRTPDGPPETALLLAELCHRLWRYAARPRWRTAGLPARVRIAWLRTELRNEPATVRHEPAGELLYQAVESITAADAVRPEELVRELAASGDPVLREAAVRLIREGVHGALLAPGRAREHLVELLDGPSAAAALRELAEPWAAVTPIPRERLPAVDDVIAVAARHGHPELLRDILADEARPPRARQAALRALGELAGREHLPELIATANADPLLLGAAAVDCLRAMHRRGLFPGGDDAAAVVALALADHTIDAARVATILFTCRHQAFDALVSGEADDPGWPRRLALLVALAQQGSDDLAVGDAVTRLLPSASRPEVLLAAIRTLGYQPAETAVLDLLPRAPAAALDALEAIGGAPTVTVLRDGLGLGPAGDGVAAHLRPVRHRALELLWHLADEPGLRRAILARLDPRDVPRRIRSDLGGPDRDELALLSAGVDRGEPARAGAGADPGDAVRTLIRLARNGDATVLPAIADLLLRVTADVTVRTEPGEPAVPGEVVAAVHALGARLHERGKLRPFCLRAASSADAAGHALVATIALDLLDRPDLSDPERAVLLALLREAPYPGTRARVHRLLRHPDPHVRKHVIAVLTGDDAEALSASLIALTTAPDPQTVRSALLALGELRARWAAPAIAACLQHPVMNVKKTAAAALVRAGTPAAVPALLFWLGHHDNPGLRATLVEALRAVLGTAYPATVLAAAERAGDDRTRELLLDGLGHALSARAVGALAEQGSPVAPMLLELVAAGRVPLGAGTVEDLAAQLAAHGIAAPAGPAVTPGDDDIDLLTLDDWDDGIARRILDRSASLGAGQLDRLRPTLAGWLRLATLVPEVRTGALRLALRICPAPWSAGEVDAFGRAVPALVDGLAGERDELFAVLEAVVPAMEAARALEVAARIRGLAPSAGGRRSPLALLRRCGAILTRTDVEQALAAARLGPDPWLAETALLREAFEPGPDEDAAWRVAVEAAVRTTYQIKEFRSFDGDRTVASAARLNALIAVFPAAGQDVRGVLLDWMEALQPIDAPRWTIAESARRPAEVARQPHDGDLDQPRSAAQRARLLALLESADASRRDAAAVALLEWPEPEIRQAVVHAFLHGRVDVTITGTVDFIEAGADPERTARLAWQLDAAAFQRLVPALLQWWEHDDARTRAAAGRALRGSPGSADALAENLRERLDAGAWGFLDLLAGRPLLRTPALTELSRRLRAEGREDPLVLVDGPLRDPGAAAEDAAALAALRERPAPAAGGPSRQELVELIRTGRAEQVRRALTLFAETCPDDPELEKLLAGLLEHPQARVRLHAHRIGRRALSRATYLGHTVVLLDDPEPGVVRSAINTLSHAGYRPAIAAMVELLGHSHVTVRRAAADGLVRFGPAAVPALTRAAAHARPDRRIRYTAVLDQIAG